MTDRRCRWGILSTAEIAKKNWKAIWNADNATLTAVASRDVTRAQSFVDFCQTYAAFDPAPMAWGSYEALLESPDVDAVYIPIPTGLRKKWAISAAEAGKHVLLEKPCSLNARDLGEIIAACQASNVQFMDGVMMMHTDRLKAMRRLLDDGESVGEIRRITTAVSFHGGDEFLASNIRVRHDLEPQGCFGDVGWYCIRGILWALNWQLPQTLTARILKKTETDDSESSVPLEASAELFFANGVTASFYCSFVTEMQQWLTIAGTKGYLHSTDFMLPRVSNEQSFESVRTVFDKFGVDMLMEYYITRHAVAEHGSGHKTAQETNLIRNFSALALNGKPASCWGEFSMQTQLVLDACIESARRSGAPVEVG